MGDSDDEADYHRRAVAAAVERHRKIQDLAADRTTAAGLCMVLSRRARQRASMKPYLLAVGTRCRISFLYSPTVRMHVKSALVNTFLPAFTPDLYKITARRLAPGSKRVVLYDLSTVEELETGAQAPTRIGVQLVRLPVALTGCDRRWLMPVADARGDGRDALIRAALPASDARVQSRAARTRQRDAAVRRRER